jgi:hypothetical protein
MWRGTFFICLRALALLPTTAGQRVESESARQLWKPAVGEPWQIVLSSIVDGNLTHVIEPQHVKIFDVDLFDTSKEAIRNLKSIGKKVICYFSAGTSEDWREDYKLFKPTHQGAKLPLWPGEKWLDIREPEIFEIMKKRIRLAQSKGCDAVDPDNMGEFWFW